MSERPRTLTWLHIGDFHVKDGDSYDRDTVLKALVESVRDQRERLGRKPDLIFVTGDIANSGAASQYKRATTFLEELEQATGITRDHVFAIPGNHDVDRAKGYQLKRTLDTVQESHTFFGSADDVKLHLRKQAGFREWYNRYFRGIRKLSNASTCESPIVVDVNGLSIAVAQINTSLFCQGDDDHNKLWVGRRCLDPVIDQVRKDGADIRIALMHHPLDWLHDEERANITALLRDNFDVLLRGHLHETGAESVAGITGNALHLACGATYQGSQWPNRVLYVTANYDAGKLLIYPLRYEDKPRPIWTTDPSVFPKESPHEGSLPLGWKSKVSSHKTWAGRENGPENSNPLPNDQNMGAGDKVTGGDQQTTLEPSPKISRNILPHHYTSFIGRKRQLNAVHSLLRKKQLVTLTGTAGVGKTRLALQVAADLLTVHRNGIAWVEVASLYDATFIPQTVMAALGLWEQRGSSPLDQIIIFLSDRRFLLVIDNCEHLINECAHFVDAILRACPNVVILVTSREPLGITGESVFLVPPLSVPDATQRVLPLSKLRQVEAIKLFVERAQSSDPSFKLTSQNANYISAVCSQLDGIPLAIELAAVRVRVMSIEQIYERLAQRFNLLTGGSRVARPQHQTLRAAIDWSYDPLSDEEKLVFNRLSVFSGGWTMRAAEQICEGESNTGIVVNESEILDVMTALVDKSLILAEDQDGSKRYRLLESLREYAVEKLQTNNEAEQFQLRHCDWFLALAEEAEKGLLGREQAMWLIRLDTEYSNLRAALHWSVQNADEIQSGDKGLRLSGALLRYWQVRGQLAEGHTHLARAIGREWKRTKAVAKALNAEGTLARDQGDFTTAQSLFKDSLAISRELGDDQRVANILNNFGLNTYYQGDFEAARSMLEESLTLCHSLGDKAGIAYAVGNLAIVASEQGHHSKARLLFDESLSTYQEIEDIRGVSITLNNIAIVALIEGKFEESQQLHKESYEIRRKLKDKPGMANSLVDMGCVAKHLDDYKSALLLLEESRMLFEEIGDRSGVAYSLGAISSIYLEQGNYYQARWFLSKSLILYRELGEKHSIPISLETAGGICFNESKLKAIVLWAAADRLREIIGAPLPPRDKIEIDNYIIEARKELGDEAVDIAWEEGHSMTLEQAIEYALGELL